MAGEIVISFTGNLTADPELRFTPSGHAVASFDVANTPRTYDAATSEWKDGDTTFLKCEVWRQYAENVAESLKKGMRVMVSGNLKSRTYEKDGVKHTVFEVDAQEVGPVLRNATAVVTKVQSNGTARTASPASPAAAPAAAAQAPAAAAAPAAPAAGGFKSDF